jgi:hypothetical protein
VVIAGPESVNQMAIPKYKPFAHPPEDPEGSAGRIRKILAGRKDIVRPKKTDAALAHAASLSPERKAEVFQKAYTKDRPRDFKFTPPEFGHLENEQRIGAFERPGGFSDKYADLPPHLRKPESRQTTAPRSYEGKQRAFAKPVIPKPLPEHGPHEAKKVSFTPRKLHEIPPKSTVGPLGVPLETENIYGMSSQKERDPKREKAHGDTIDELRGAISESTKDRLAQAKFLGQQGEDTTVGDIRAGIDEEDGPLGEEQEGPREKSVKRYLANAGAPEAPEGEEPTVDNLAALKIRKFISENPSIMQSHVPEANAANFASKQIGESPGDIIEKITGVHKKQVPLIEGNDVFEEPDDTEVAPPKLPEAPEHTLASDEAIEREFIKPARVQSKPNPTATYLAKLAPSANFKNRVLEGQSGGKDAMAKKMREVMLKLKVRKYGGEKPPKVTESKPKPKVKYSTGRLGGAESRFSAVEKLKELPPDKQKLTKLEKVDTLLPKYSKKPKTREKPHAT